MHTVSLWFMLVHVLRWSPSSRKPVNIPLETTTPWKAKFAAEGLDCAYRGRHRLIRMDPDGCYMSTEMLNTLHNDLGIDTDVIPGDCPSQESFFTCALDQGRATSCQECLIQAVMSQHGAYTPVQLLFGHESAPIAGETLDDEQQGRSITDSMAERLTRQQSAMKAWLQAEAESRGERAQNRRTQAVLRWRSGTRVCYWRADVPGMGSLPTIRQGSTAILNKHKGAWVGPATVLSQEMSRSQEGHEEAHGTVWIVVQGRLLRCAPEHLRHLSERGSLTLNRD